MRGMRMKRVRWIGLMLLAAGSLSGVEPPGRNPKVAGIVEQISAENLKAHVQALAAIHSRHILSPQIQEAWEYIRKEFEKNERLQVELDEFEAKLRRLGDQPVRLVNVVATLPGSTDPDRIYVVSGHYDSRASRGSDAESRAPGAVDDASGTAAVIELARVMSRHQFEATLVFIAFSGEEAGLLGSRHWADRAREQGLQVDAMITNDIIGNSQGGGGHLSNTEMRVFSEGVPAAETEQQARLRQSIGGEVDSPARQLARHVKEMGEFYVPGFKIHLIYRRDRFGRGGDHTSFSRAGYPAVRFSEMYENYTRQHQDVRQEDGVQYGDLPEFFDADYSAAIVRVNAAVLASMADAPAPPSNLRIRGAVRYDTTLSWEASQAADHAGYAILVRETSAPYWQRRIPVGNVTEYVLKGTIVDNFFFAVQSVDEDGNLSRPVFPQRLRRR